MPRFGGEINLWLKYWRTQKLSSEAKQSGNKGGGVGEEEKIKEEKSIADKHNQSDGVTLGLGRRDEALDGSWVWSTTVQVEEEWD